MALKTSYNTEAGFDGGVLEVSVNGGAFQDILAAGGSFATGGYNGTIGPTDSVLNLRQAWTGNSGGFITTTVNLPPGSFGQNAQFRWRVAYDTGTSPGGGGLRIDTISINTVTYICCGACVITCPANITQPNTPGQCGAIVTFPAISYVGNCGTVTASPVSGSFFPVGTTTVVVTGLRLDGTSDSCSFTVTVNDTQPPAITCPGNITGVTDQNVCPSPACRVITFALPVAMDNCPKVTVACTPPSGSCFPVGTTSVTCTETDMAGNTASCSFTVTVFDVALQDDSNPGTILLWNSLTGAYRFCCNGTTYTGIGKVRAQGCLYTLEHTAAEKRLLGKADKAVHGGSASIQAPPGTIRCTILDRNTLNDTGLASCQ